MPQTTGTHNARNASVPPKASPKEQEQEKKRTTTIFVRSEIDQLNLSIEAFRVYGHLARRASAKGVAWPSYSSIGETCFRGSFPKAKPESLRRKAIKAVKELEEEGLIRVERRKVAGKKEHTSNRYFVLALEEIDPRP